MPDPFDFPVWGLEVDWLLRYLDKKGVSGSDIKNIAPEATVSPRGNHLNLDEYLILFAWSSERLDAPHLGLDIASELLPGDLGIYGYLIRNAPTLGGMLDILVRYQAIFMQGMAFRTIKIRQVIQLEWQIFRPYSEGVRQDIEFTLAAFIRLVRLNLGAMYAPKLVEFCHPATPPITRYEDFFGCPVKFGSERNFLSLPQEHLGRQCSKVDPELLEVLKEQADTLLHRHLKDNDLLSLVKSHIAMSLGVGGSDLDSIASKLNTTARTLERRLARINCSYRQLREAVVLEIAKEALLGSDYSIQTIATRLGYSNSSAFVRAFKRMTGTTPRLYRAAAENDFA